MIPSEYVNKSKSRGSGPSRAQALAAQRSRLKARASISGSPGSQKPSLSPGFQAEPGPHITIDKLFVDSPKLTLMDVDLISYHYTYYIYFSIKFIYLNTLTT